MDDKYSSPRLRPRRAVRLAPMKSSNPDSTVSCGQYPLRSQLIPTLLAAGLLAVAQLVLLYFCFDFDASIYVSGGILPRLFRYGTMLVIALLIFLPQTCRSQAEALPTTLPTVGSFTTFSAALCAFLYAAFLVLQVMEGLPVLPADGLTGYLRIIAMLCAVPSAMYFLVMAMSRVPYSRLTATLGFFPVIWAACYLMIIYFDRSVSMNNPLRVLMQISLICMMVYFLGELRFQVNRAKPLWYLGFSYAAVVILTVSAVPKLILTVLLGWQGIPDLAYGLAEIAVLLYILSRLLSFQKDKDR